MLFSTNSSPLVHPPVKLFPRTAAELPQGLSPDMLTVVIIALMMEAVCTSETSVSFNVTTQ
jgi:hypothetical protein